MRRRAFIAGLGAALWTGSGWSAEKRPRIGVLTLLTSQDDVGRVSAFMTGLGGLGYSAGQTIDVDLRYANGDTSRLQPLAAELAAFAPDLVYAGEPSAARAAKAQMSNVPIVCPTLNDTEIPSLFASYAHPGGNVTGIARFVEDMNGKVVELALDMLPGTTRVGLLVNPAGANRAISIAQTEAAARRRGVTVTIAEARLTDDLGPAFDHLAKAQAQLVIVVPNAMFIIERRRIAQLALDAAMPSFFQELYHVRAGGLASYGVDETACAARTAALAAKILRGATPADLPIEFLNDLKLVINLETAKALGLGVPQSLLLSADEVIE